MQSTVADWIVGAQVDPNEPRNHPDWDAPVDKMQEAVNPPDPGP